MSNKTQIKHQTSETFLLSAILSFSGGLQDAYTYCLRDKVFANAQTGNVVMMSQYFMTGELMDGIQYMAPLFAFAFGVIVAEIICHRYKDNKVIHWRQIVIFIEIIILFSVGFIPEKYNMLATSLVSLSCSMQVESFRTIHGFGYASTMCIGNLRSGMENLYLCIRDRDRNALIKVYYYFGVITTFSIGAGVGKIFSDILELKTIWLCCVVLLICYFLMMIKKSFIHTKNRHYSLKPTPPNKPKENSSDNVSSNDIKQSINIKIENNDDHCHHDDNDDKDEEKEDEKINQKSPIIDNREILRSSIRHENEDLNNNCYIQDMVNEDIVQESYSSIQKIITDDIEKSQSISFINDEDNDNNEHHINDDNNYDHSNNNNNSSKRNSIRNDNSNNNINNKSNNSVNNNNSYNSNNNSKRNTRSSLDNEIIHKNSPSANNSIINSSSHPSMKSQNKNTDDSGQKTI